MGAAVRRGSGGFGDCVIVQKLLGNSGDGGAKGNPPGQSLTRVIADSYTQV